MISASIAFFASCPVCAPSPLAQVPQLTAAGWIDAAALAFIGVSVVIGAVRGMAGEFSRLLAFAAGLAVLSVSLGPIRSAAFPGDAASQSVLAFAASVVLASLAGCAVHAAARRFLRLLVGQPADGLLGAVMRGASAAATIVAVFAFIKLLPFPAVRRTVFKESVSGRAALPAVEWLHSRLGAGSSSDAVSVMGERAAGAAAPALGEIAAGKLMEVCGG